MKKASYSRYCKMAISILTQIPNVQTFEDLDLKGYTEADVRAFIYDCYENHYINLFDAYRDANGDPHLARFFSPALTLSGYQFLNSLYASDSLKKSRSAKITSIITIIISLTSLAIGFFNLYLQYLQYLNV